MRKFLLAAAAVAAIFAASPASAHPHYQGGYHYTAPWRAYGGPGWGYQGWGYRNSPYSHYPHRRRSYGQAYPHYRGGNDGRPADCYGIAWCGCYLRHILGIGNTAFNLAIHWLNYGHPVVGPRVGAVAVGPHHVARVIGTPDASGRWLIQDGNDGPVRVHRRSLAWAHWFRMG